MKRIQCTLTTLLLLSATTAVAQINLRHGYIITNLNDTIQGQIDFRTDERNSTVCDFYSAGSDQKESYKPGDIYAYRFTDDGKFYVSRKVTIYDKPQTLFLEYLIKGVVSLYYYKDDADHFFFENEEGRMVEATKDVQEIITRSSHTNIRTGKQYVGVMTWMFQDSEKVKKQIPKLDLTKSDLIKITKEYHYETCETGEQCIEFENKPDKHFLEFAFTAATGVRMHSLYSKYMYRNWKMSRLNSNFPSPVLTLGTNISVPRMGPATSVQLEVDFSQINGENDYPGGETGYPHIRLKTLLTDVRIGVRRRLSENKTCPFIEGGFNYSHIWNDEGTLVSLINGPAESTKDIQINTNEHLIGIYAAAGVVIGMKKHSLIIQGLFQFRVIMQDNLATAGLSVGLTL